jgi:hypothetical protein
MPDTKTKPIAPAPAPTRESLTKELAEAKAALEKALANQQEEMVTSKIPYESQRDPSGWLGLLDLVVKLAEFLCRRHRSNVHKPSALSGSNHKNEPKSGFGDSSGFRVEHLKDAVLFMVHLALGYASREDALDFDNRGAKSAGDFRVWKIHTLLARDSVLVTKVREIFGAYISRVHTEVLDHEFKSLAFITLEALKLYSG